ncbi:hypothetical protein PC114_g22467 [Phytophthora cactorum]|nr:hypothetical protein PC114_g22467 [Phytophthora cactorum]
MAEAPPGQKRKRDEPPGTRKRRRVRSSVERASAETARSLGGVAAFKDVWGALVKAGWTSKRPSSKCLDSRYKYIEDIRVVAAEQAAQQMASVALSIRQPTLNPTRKEIATRKRQEFPVQQASLGTALSPGVVRKEEVEDAQPDVLRARIAQKVCGVEDDGCEVGGDDSMSISFNYGVSGAASQAVVAGRGSRGRGAGGRRGGRTARRVARASSPTGVGVSGAAGQEGVAGPGARGRGVRGGRGGRTARRAASTASAEGDEVDSSEVGFDMDVSMDVDGTAGQSVGSSRGVRGLVAAATGETGAATTPSYTPPIMLQDVYVSKLVAFSPDKERWMKAKIYRPIGTAYIIGRVQFQSVVEHISVGVVQLGIKNYVALTRVKNPDWRILVRPDPTDEIDFEEDDSDCEEEVLQAFDPSELLPTSLAEVEAIKSMRFDPNGEVEGP